MSAVWPPARRLCEVCAESYQPRSTNQRFCNERCRNRATYQAMKNDPERWAAYLARMRARYVPSPRVPTDRRCSVESCEVKHFAKGFCRRHYYLDRYRRGLDRRRHPQFTMALIRHYDEAGKYEDDATTRRLVCSVSPGLLIPECPDCGGVMRKIENTQGYDLRDCGGCRVVARLNGEEVEWLTSETRSTEQRERTSN